MQQLVIAEKAQDQCYFFGRQAGRLLDPVAQIPSMGTTVLVCSKIEEPRGKRYMAFMSRQGESAIAEFV